MGDLNIQWLVWLRPFPTNSSHHTITRYYLLYYLPLTNTNTMTSNWSRWVLHKPRARDGSGPLWSPHRTPWHPCSFEGNVLRSDNIHTEKEERAVLRAFEEQSPVTLTPFVASSFTRPFLVSRLGVFLKWYARLFSDTGLLSVSKQEPNCSEHCCFHSSRHYWKERMTVVVWF